MLTLGVADVAWLGEGGGGCENRRRSVAVVINNYGVHCGPTFTYTLYWKLIDQEMLSYFIISNIPWFIMYSLTYTRNKDAIQYFNS